MKVSYNDHFGNDLKVVNMARQSFGKRKTTFDDKDAGLIAFLARGCERKDWQNHVYNLQAYMSTDEIEEVLYAVKRMPTHWAPFGHCSVTIDFKAPILVARQLQKHQIGFVWSEESRRYVDYEPEIYIPDVVRAKAENVKQGSGDAHRNSAMWVMVMQRQANEAARIYNSMIADGVCPEQARGVLPQWTMVNWSWTGTLLGWSRMAVQRLDPHAQQETREVAQMVSDIIAPLYPVSWRELTR